MADRPQPTDGELEILEVLWRVGPATVRQVHDQVGGVGYTTILKLMQIMVDKGLLERDTATRSHVYRPAESAETTQSGLVEDLIERAFAGSASQLVLRALAGKRTPPEELREIRRLLRRIEKEGPT